MENIKRKKRGEEERIAKIDSCEMLKVEQFGKIKFC